MPHKHTEGPVRRRRRRKTPLSRDAGLTDLNDPESQAIRDEEHDEPLHARSITDVAGEALRSGVVDGPALDVLVDTPDRLQVGDPDTDPMQNQTVGEDLPGGSTPTPDQNQVDDIGSAYGVTEEDGANVSSTEEVVGRRDRRRWELDPRSKD
jgi:hypothetical protein